MSGAPDAIGAAPGAAPRSLADFERAYPPRAGLPPGAEVTRIAPSPTGFPHIGTGLQGTINRALATRTGGVFILRIEDTDQGRLVSGAVEAIVAGLRWLDLVPDEGPGLGGDYGPYAQSERLALYRAAADQLVAQGDAYHCFCTPERLDAVRQAQTAAGENPMYDGHCRTLPRAEVEARLARGEPSAIRMRIPAEEEIEFTDLVRGTIRIQAREVDDGVILKSDGFPTYHLAVVVDDHFMRVTTTVRGEEWISSTPKHVLLYRYLGWEVPRIVHTPLLRDAQRRKLSKRSGDTSLAYFAMQGILPEAFRNFLTRLIWVHGQDQDVYPFADFVAGLSADALPKSGPVADFALLEFINAQYLRQLDGEALYAAVLDVLDRLIAAGQGYRDTFGLEPAQAEQAAVVPHDDLVAARAAYAAHPEVARAALALKPERFKRVTEMLLETRLYFAELFVAPDGASLVKAAGSAEVALALLDAYAAAHATIAGSAEAWEGWARGEATARGVKPGPIFMLLRLAITGSRTSPPTYDVARIVGDAETLRRIALARAAVAGA